MQLSELQLKEVIDITSGKKIGVIVDVSVDSDGRIRSFTLEERRGRKFMPSKEEYELLWNQIIKFGDDIILVDTRRK